MTFWVFLIIQLLIAAGAGFAFWRLIRLTSRCFREGKTTKGAGFGFLSLLVALVAIFFILAVFGGIIRVL